MESKRVNLALRVLDDQLIDADGTRFGRVDDLELEGGQGEQPRVAALLVGAGAWRWRVPRHLSTLTAAITPDVVRGIPWELVRSIEPGQLRIGVSKGELGIGTAHPASARWVGELESQTLRLTSLLGTPVLEETGEQLGRVHEVRAEVQGSLKQPGETRVTGLLVGRAGWMQRLIGAGHRGDRGPGPDAGLVDWSRVERVQPDGIVVSEDRN
jgi:sporulation protein YlmC with PRC-barrel domain